MISITGTTTNYQGVVTSLGCPTGDIVAMSVTIGVPTSTPAPVATPTPAPSGATVSCMTLDAA
jgi:hypothetical protein